MFAKKYMLFTVSLPFWGEFGMFGEKKSRRAAARKGRKYLQTENTGA